MQLKPWVIVLSSSKSRPRRRRQRDFPAGCGQGEAHQGQVISVGRASWTRGKRMEMGIRAGDLVYYGKYSGTEIEVNSEKFVILRESDVLACWNNRRIPTTDY